MAALTTADAITACLQRFLDQKSKQLKRTAWAGEETMKRQYYARQAWFDARENYLREEARKAINAADNIIGKQWAYDHLPKCDIEGWPSDAQDRR